MLLERTVDDLRVAVEAEADVDLAPAAELDRVRADRVDVGLRGDQELLRVGDVLRLRRVEVPPERAERHVQRLLRAVHEVHARRAWRPSPGSSCTWKPSLSARRAS